MILTLTLNPTTWMGRFLVKHKIKKPVTISIAGLPDSIRLKGFTLKSSNEKVLSRITVGFDPVRRRSFSYGENFQQDCHPAALEAKKSHELPRPE
jgi:hypothetical protein